MAYEDNNLEIKGEDKNTHLSNLITAVEKAAEVYQRKMSTPEPEVAQFCLQIASNLKLLEYFRDQNRVFGIPRYSSMVIDPSASGFPSFNWLYKLYGEASIIEVKKTDMPSNRIIVGNAKRRILQGVEPKSEQDLLAIASYFEQYAKTELIPIAKAESKVIFTTGDDDLDKRIDSSEEIIFQIDVIGRDNLESQYSYSRIKVVGKKDNSKLKENLDLLCKNLGEVAPSRTAQYTFGMMNSTIYEFRPMSVEKYTIGPFLSKWTKHNEGITKMFEFVENPFMLILAKEKVVSERTEIQEDKRLWKKPVVTKIEHRSNAVFENSVVCPFELKEAFEKMYQIMGEKVNIFGITQGGEVYGGSSNN